MTLVFSAARRWLLLFLAGFSLLATPVAAATTHPLKIEPLDVVTSHGVYHFKVEVADQEDTRTRGLMFRTHLAADQGMLFDFKTSQTVAFWMRNTLIPLDMIFIAADGRIINIARNAVPHDETPIPSGGEVLGVLEVRGGRAAEIGVEPGDHVRHRIFGR